MLDLGRSRNVWACDLPYPSQQNSVTDFIMHENSTFDELYWEPEFFSGATIYINISISYSSNGETKCYAFFINFLLK